MSTLIPVWKREEEKERTRDRERERGRERKTELCIERYNKLGEQERKKCKREKERERERERRERENTNGYVLGHITTLIIKLFVHVTVGKQYVCWL